MLAVVPVLVLAACGGHDEADSGATSMVSVVSTSSRSVVPVSPVTSDGAASSTIVAPAPTTEAPATPSTEPVAPRPDIATMMSRETFRIMLLMLSEDDPGHLGDLCAMFTADPFDALAQLKSTGDGSFDALDYLAYVELISPYCEAA